MLYISVPALLKYIELNQLQYDIANSNILGYKKRIDPIALIDFINNNKEIINA